MSKSAEILELLKNIPQGYLSTDDEFFSASKVYLLKSYKKLGAIGSCETKDINGKFTLGSPKKEIFCNVLGCDMIFESVCSYQVHYNTMHRFKCSECKKSMPTEHLLDLHISEQHDSFFKTRVERGECLHKCYLEECRELFFNPQERKEHCIKEHSFPSNFRFDKMGQKHHKNKQSLFKDGILQTALDTAGENKKVHKFLSFGHQKEKTFHTKIGCKHESQNGKTLEKMDTLEDALNSI